MQTTRADEGHDVDPSASAAVAWIGVAAVVVVHLAVLGLLGDEASLSALLAAQVFALLAVAGFEVGFGSASFRTLSALAVCWAVLAGGTLFAATAAGPTVAAGGLATVAAVGCYGLHRYELVALGLVEVADERE